MNVYRITVPTDIDQTRLYPLLRRMLPELPEYALREAFHGRDVKMNGVRVGREEPALAGAEICVYTRHAAIRECAKILYVDENVAVVVKPVGVSCEADAKGGKTIAELVLSALRQEEPEAEMPLLCHRLDNQTDGLLLLARNEAAERELTEAFKHRHIHKEYTCLVKGIPNPTHRVLEGYLQKDAAKARVRVLEKPGPGAVPIVTEYTLLEPGEVSRLLVRLHTGRTHQIRAQMAAIGHPLLGDDAYGDRDLNRTRRAKRLMLCATGLSFELTGALAYLNEKRFQMEAPF